MVRVQTEVNDVLPLLDALLQQARIWPGLHGFRQVDPGEAMR
ncbi:hypothetical protein BH23CHL5_BH23CHL5_18460 [soil metagenome]